MLYAKSDPPESINEHTEKLLKNLKILRNVYENIVDKNPNIGTIDARGTIYNYAMDESEFR